MMYDFALLMAAAGRWATALRFFDKTGTTAQPKAMHVLCRHWKSMRPASIAKVRLPGAPIWRTDTASSSFVVHGSARPTKHTRAAYAD
jgi:hypothetical protein